MLGYTLGNQFFPTKSAVIERARAILRETSDGEAVTETDTAFLFSLFHHHDEWGIKSANGVWGLSTKTTAHGTRCFVLCKSDGAIDISFMHAVRLLGSSAVVPGQPQALRDFKNAARTAVSYQIAQFREDNYGRRWDCPVTGERLTRGNVCVDHVAPLTFDQLAFDFCTRAGINPLAVKVLSKHGVIAVFEDQVVCGLWQSFHRTSANLRLVSMAGNLRLPKPRLDWSTTWSGATL